MLNRYSKVHISPIFERKKKKKESFLWGEICLLAMDRIGCLDQHSTAQHMQAAYISFSVDR